MLRKTIKQNTHYREYIEPIQDRSTIGVLGVLIEIRTGKQRIKCKKARNGAGLGNLGGAEENGESALRMSSDDQKPC